MWSWGVAQQKCRAWHCASASSHLEETPFKSGKQSRTSFDTLRANGMWLSTRVLPLHLPLQPLHVTPDRNLRVELLKFVSFNQSTMHVEIRKGVKKFYNERDSLSLAYTFSCSLSFNGINSGFLYSVKPWEVLIVQQLLHSAWLGHLRQSRTCAHVLLLVENRSGDKMRPAFIVYDS